MSRSRPTGGPAEGLRRDAAENRARLLDAAERVFAEHGTGATMEDIARAAGSVPPRCTGASAPRRPWYARSSACSSAG